MKERKARFEGLKNQSLADGMKKADLCRDIYLNRIAKGWKWVVHTGRKKRSRCWMLKRFEGGFGAFRLMEPSSQFLSYHYTTVMGVYGAPKWGLDERRGCLVPRATCYLPVSSPTLRPCLSRVIRPPSSLVYKRPASIVMGTRFILSE